MIKKNKFFVNSPSEIIYGDDKLKVKVVNDAEKAKEELLKGNLVARFEYGDSMSPILESGQYCVLHPIKSSDDISIGDAVFCEVNGYLMTHMVLLKSDSSPYDSTKYLICSTKLGVFGWTDKVYGFAHGTQWFEKPLLDEFSNQLVDIILEYEGENEDEFSKLCMKYVKYFNKYDENELEKLVLENKPYIIFSNMPLNKAEKLKTEFENIGAEIKIKYD